MTPTRLRRRRSSSSAGPLPRDRIRLPRATSQGRTHMHRLGRILAVGAAVGALALATVGGAAAASADSGHVYVNNNTAGHNTISGFDRHADGTLTPIAGTPFDAGGAGFGAPTASAGALQLSSDRRYVIEVNAVANDVAVLKIKQEGQLRRFTI